MSLYWVIVILIFAVTIETQLETLLTGFGTIVLGARTLAREMAAHRIRVKLVDWRLMPRGFDIYHIPVCQGMWTSTAFGCSNFPSILTTSAIAWTLSEHQSDI